MRGCVISYLVQCVMALSLLLVAPAQGHGAQMIQGKVVDERGNPVPDAQLVLVRKDRFYKSEFDLTYEDGKVGPDGTFSFKDDGLVEAWVLARRPSTGFTEYTETKPFSVQGGQTIKVDIRLPKNKGWIRGRVTDEGEPIFGATIAVCAPPGHNFATPHLMKWEDQHSTNNFLYTAKHSLPMATSNENGEFSIEGLPAGTYTVVAGADNYQLSRIPNVKLSEGQKLGGVNMQLSLTATPGRLSIRGRVVDASGAAVEHLSVSALDRSNKLQHMAFTNEIGYYRLSELAPGTYSVAVRSDTQELARRDAVPAGTAGVNLPVRLCAVHGRVFLPGGKPLSAAATVEAGATGWSITRQTKTSGSAQPPGSFSLSQLPPGQVYLTAKAPGFREAIKTVTIGGAGPVDVILELVPTCGLTVKVVEATSHEPLSGVTINLVETIESTPRWRYAGVTTADGVLIDKEVRPGKNKVVAINPNHSRSQMEINCAPGTTQEITLSLSRSSVIRGTIKDVWGHLVTGKKVTVVAVPEVPLLIFVPLQQVEGAYSGEFSGGTYSIRVPEGRYTVKTTVDVPLKEYFAGTGAPLIQQDQTIPIMAQSPHVAIGQRQTVNVDLVIKPRR